MLAKEEKRLCLSKSNRRHPIECRTFRPFGFLLFNMIINKDSSTKIYPLGLVGNFKISILNRWSNCISLKLITAESLYYATCSNDQK